MKTVFRILSLSLLFIIAGCGALSPAILTQVTAQSASNVLSPSTVIDAADSSLGDGFSNPIGQDLFILARQFSSDAADNDLTTGLPLPLPVGAQPGESQAVTFAGWSSSLPFTSLAAKVKYSVTSTVQADVDDYAQIAFSADGWKTFVNLLKIGGPNLNQSNTVVMTLPPGTALSNVQIGVQLGTSAHHATGQLTFLVYEVSVEGQ